MEPVTQSFIEDEDMGVPSVANLWKMLVKTQQQLIIYQQQQMLFQQETTAKLNKINDILSQAHGGWKVFVWVGTSLTAVASGLAWLLSHLHVFPFSK